jgi:hypothetical protein
MTLVTAPVEQVRIGWQLNIVDKSCNYCKEELKFAHSTSGKTIYCLDGVYKQFINLYHCADPACKGATEYVNPSPRLDYSGRYYGADVFRTVADFFLRVKLKAEQIHLLLQGMNLEISLSTVKSMVKDVILLKSDAIDRKTTELIKQQQQIILCLDGQQPDNGTRSLWLFTDLLSGRVLHTQLLDKADSKTLHEQIEFVLEKYQTKLGGVVSDKQNNLVKCMQSYYPQIPHQICSFHFSNNIWKHLEMFDNRIHMDLRKLIKRSILYTAPKGSLITVASDDSKEDASQVFASTRKDMKALIKGRSKKFEFLHGIDLHSKLTKFCDEMEDLLDHLPKNIQLSNIIRREQKKFSAALKKVEVDAKQAEIAFDAFQKMYTSLYNKKLAAGEIEEQLEEQFDSFWKLAKHYGFEGQRTELKSMLPNAKTSIAQYFAETTRLWDSYRTGLFQYQHFDAGQFQSFQSFQTNVPVEKMFSMEVSYILGQSGKRRIGFIIETKGEYYLRILHASQEELEEDILQGFSQERLDQLRQELDTKVREKTSEWVRTSDIGGSITTLKRKYGIQQLYITIPEEELAL